MFQTLYFRRLSASNSRTAFPFQTLQSLSHSPIRLWFWKTCLKCRYVCCVGGGLEYWFYLYLLFTIYFQILLKFIPKYHSFISCNENLLNKNKIFYTKIFQYSSASLPLTEGMVSMRTGLSRLFRVILTFSFTSQWGRWTMSAVTSFLLGWCLRWLLEVPPTQCGLETRTWDAAAVLRSSLLFELSLEPVGLGRGVGWGVAEKNAEGSRGCSALDS